MKEKCIVGYPDDFVLLSANVWKRYVLLGGLAWARVEPDGLQTSLPTLAILAFYATENWDFTVKFSVV